MRLFSALTAAIVFAVSAPVKADEPVTYGKVVRAYAAVSCLALEGILSINEAVKTLFRVLKTYDIEPYQVKNFMNISNFNDDVRDHQNTASCQSLSRDYKKALNDYNKTTRQR